MRRVIRRTPKRHRTLGTPKPNVSRRLRDVAAPAVAALVSAACGAATEGRWHDRDPRPLEPLSTEETVGDSGQIAADGSRTGDSAATPGRGQPGTRGSANRPPQSLTGTTPTAGPPATSMSQGPDSVPPVNQSQPPVVQPPETPQVACDTSPQFVIFDEAGPTIAAPTPASWLAVSAASDRLSWHHAASSLTLLLVADNWEWVEPDRAALAQSPPEDGIDPNVQWAELLGNHATSTTLTLERLSALYDSEPGALAADSGGLSITPDGNFVVQTRCEEGAPSIRAWDTASGELTMFVEASAPCFTSVLALDDALLLGSRQGIRSYGLPGGAPSFEVSTDGIVGRIDASADAERLALSLVRTDLIELEPGMFEAVGQVLDSPGVSHDTSPDEYVIGGALLPNADFSPGYVTVPHAIHPYASATAYFTADERLVLRNSGVETELLVEGTAGPRDETPRATNLPTLVDFSPDGAWLFAIRGRWLNVFDCR